MPAAMLEVPSENKNRGLAYSPFHQRPDQGTFPPIVFTPGRPPPVGLRRPGKTRESHMKFLLGSLALACALLVHPPMARALPAGQGSATAELAGEAAYDPQNPFARIIRGELPAYTVYEDAHVLAFLSLDQRAPGHVLVISKISKAQDILQMAPQELARVMLVAQRVARAEVEALHADGVVIQQNNGDAGGQTVFHLHVHVVPHWEDAPPEFARDADGKLDRTAIAARIAAAVEGDGID